MAKSEKIVELDTVCGMIMDCRTFLEIATHYKIATSTLLAWIERKPERSSRVREARTMTAKLWDDMALQAILTASNSFELNKAAVLSAHCKWRASKVAVKEYGDKLSTEITGANGDPIKVDVEFVN